MSCVERTSIVAEFEQRPAFPRLVPAPPPDDADAPLRLVHDAPPTTRRPRPAGNVPLSRVLPTITLTWFFGAVWFNTTTGAPLTLFAKGLRATPFQFGLLAAIPYLASLISLPASLLIERTGCRKGIFLAGLYLQRLTWVPLALVPLWIVGHHGVGAAGRAMTAFLWLFLLTHAGQAVGGPAWVSWMADVVPGRVRGKYFSRRKQWGTLSAVPAALLVGWLLDRYAGTRGTWATLSVCALIFLAAAVFGLADIALFQFVPAVPKPARCGAQLLRSFCEPLRNRRFLWFAAFVGVLTFAFAATGQFFTLYLIDHLGVRNTDAQLMLLVVPLLAQFVVLPAWGRAVDRMGKRPVLAVAALGLVPVGLGWTCLAPSNAHCLGYLLAAAGTALWAGVEVANFNHVCEMSASGAGGANSGGGSAYVAVNSVVINLAGCLGGLAAGALVQSLHDWSWHPLAGCKTFTAFDVLCAATALLRLAAAAAFLPFLHEPAARPAREAVRFMTASICRNVSGAVWQPLRIAGWKKSERLVRAAA